MDMDTVSKKAERVAWKVGDKLERDTQQIGQLIRSAQRGFDRALNWLLIATLAMIPVAFLLSGLQWLILAIIQ